MTMMSSTGRRALAAFGGGLSLCVGAVLAPACGGTNPPEGAPDAAEDQTSADAGRDATASDAGKNDSSPPDAGKDSASSDSGDTSTSDGQTDAGACVGAWLVPPTTPLPLSLPDGGDASVGVILHAAGVGTQNYTCDAIMDAGTTSYAWTFVGPQAELNDCHAVLLGHHFASDAGASAPEWQTLDGTYVIGHKLASVTPDGGAESIPWLLLQSASHGGTGTLSQADYIQRLNTDGGIAPSTTTCDEGATGTTVKVPYTADYFFFGP